MEEHDARMYMKIQERKAFTNRLLYQLSYVGFWLMLTVYQIIGRAKAEVPDSLVSDSLFLQKK